MTHRCGCVDMPPTVPGILVASSLESAFAFAWLSHRPDCRKSADQIRPPRPRTGGIDESMGAWVYLGIGIGKPRNCRRCRACAAGQGRGSTGTTHKRMSSEKLTRAPDN